MFFETETTLEIAGLPQSATGQSSIFTGINTAKIIGRHLSGFPSPTIEKVIKENNILKVLKNKGFRVEFANVYTKKYIDMLFDTDNNKIRPSTTTVMSMSASLRFKQVFDLNCGRGLYHDITSELLFSRGYEVDIITPEIAARNFYNISKSNNFTLFEHFKCDIIGHSQNMDKAIGELIIIDRFMGELLNIVDLQEFVIVITSDHGNVEDLSIKTHTNNKVPTMIISENRKINILEVKTLLDIFPMLIEILCNDF